MPVDIAPTVSVHAAQDSDAPLNVRPWAGETRSVANPVLTYSGGLVGHSTGQYIHQETWRESQERPYTVTFTFTGAQMAAQFLEYGRTGTRVRVDGKDVTGVRQGKQNSGELTRVELRFRDARPRLIQLDSSLPFMGLSVTDPKQVQVAHLPARPRAVFLGDSHTDGTGADATFTSWAGLSGTALGWDTWVSGVGGTGYVNPGPPKVTLGDRLERDVLSVKPDIVVVAAGANDVYYTAEEERRAAHELYARIRTRLPKARLIVVGPFYKASAPSEQAVAVDEALRAEAQAVGATFIDPLNWLQGCDECMWTDGAHFNQKGHNRLASKFLNSIK